MYPRLPEMNKLSKYRISRNEIGRGAFSKVYVAVHIKTNTKTAMKIVKLKNLEKSFYQLCINEVSLLKSIKSPHVLQYIDSFTTYDYLHLTTEFIDGPDLAERIQVARERGKLFSERTIWYLFHQICAGLKDLHEHRILHRDIKPANILVTKKCQVKIGDLGLSHHFSGKNSTRVNAEVGTEYYMSPERAKREYYGFPADIWSLGCILYELCTFRSPFSGEIRNPFSLHQKIVNREIIDPPMNEYSVQLCYFMDACLSLKVEERPSAEECYIAASRMHIKFEEMLHDYQKSAAASKCSS